MKLSSKSIFTVLATHLVAGAFVTGCSKQDASFTSGPSPASNKLVSEISGNYPAPSPSASVDVNGSYPDPASSPSPTQTSGSYPTPSASPIPSASPSATSSSGAGGYPTPSPSASSTSSVGGYPVPIPSVTSTSGSGGYPTPKPSSTSGAGGYPTPNPTSISGFGGYPTPNPTSISGLGGYPTPNPTSISGLGGYPTPNPTSGSGVYPTPSPTSSSSPASSPTSLPVVPNAVCGPSVTTGQAMLANTSKLVAVLYRSDSFSMNSGSTVVQAWDSPSQTGQLYSQLAAMKPFQLSLNAPLSAGTYALVFYDANQVNPPYSYDWTNATAAVAPLQDSIAHFLDANAVISVDSSGKISMPSNYNVLVGLQGSSACNGAGLIDPLTVNLGSTPIQLSSQAQGVSMDLDGNGTMNQISWFTQPAQAALLVNLTGGMPANGAIGPAQIFGNFTAGPDGQVAANGYDALAKYDDNGDGVIDSKDKIWANLRLWNDLNRDGVAQSSELIPLSQAGIVSITLPRTTANHIIKESCRNDQYGNQICQGKGAYVTVDSNGASVRKQLVDIGFKPMN